MPLGDEIDEVFRREVKSLPAYAKAQQAAGSGVAPPVDEMNQRSDRQQGSQGCHRALALQVELCSPRSHRLARRSALVAFGLSAGVLAAGPVQPVYSS